MGKIKMELPSYQAFVKYSEKIDSKTEQLGEKIAKNEELIEGLRAEYSQVFAEDGDTTKISKKLSTLVDATNHLKHELDIISNADLREKQLAAQVKEEFEAKEKEVSAYRSELWKKAERIAAEAKERVAKLKEESYAISNQFHVEVTSEQFRSVIDSLDVSDRDKETLYRKAERNYSYWPNIKLEIQ